ncbi:hypothetical protein JX265_001479 [Neoarthrinium moseri]|uniref:Uncharacterized protein n=1 Tax=Neoarthrinium moseri TaxID=1658444 RepID=A0A9Q0AUM8_9PEZI|nr:hypothetical protein JX266_012382 [Neoarthrinium moseri]KAI1879858.1 hypothetical protein JX265_001479 [Neoarthrinium moseri]
MHSSYAILALVPLALAYESGAEDSESIPVTEYLFELYGTATPTGVTGAVATSLASAVYSYQMAIYTNDAYRSAANDVYWAAATATNSDEIMSSLRTQGALNGDYTTAEWYTRDVPQSAQDEMKSVFGGFQSVATSVLGAAETTGDSASTKATVTGTNSAPSITSTPTSDSASSSNASATSSSSTAGAYVAKATGGPVAGLAAAVAIGAAVFY